MAPFPANATTALRNAGEQHFSISSFAALLGAFAKALAFALLRADSPKAWASRLFTKASSGVDITHQCLVKFWDLLEVLLQVVLESHNLEGITVLLTTEGLQVVRVLELIEEATAKEL